MAAPKSEFAQTALQTRTIPLKLRVNGTTAGDSGIYGICMNAPSVDVYTDTDGQSIPSTAGFTTTELDDDAAAGIIGVVVGVGDATELLDVRLLSDNQASASIVSSGSTLGNLASITVVRYGASSTGVTTAGDLAFTLTLTSLDLDSAIGAEDFWIEVVYRPTQPGY